MSIALKSLLAAAAHEHDRVLLSAANMVARAPMSQIGTFTVATPSEACAVDCINRVLDPEGLGGCVNWSSPDGPSRVPGTAPGGFSGWVTAQVSPLAVSTDGDYPISDVFGIGQPFWAYAFVRCAVASTLSAIGSQTGEVYAAMDLPGGYNWVLVPLSGVMGYAEGLTLQLEATASSIYGGLWPSENIWPSEDLWPSEQEDSSGGGTGGGAIVGALWPLEELWPSLELFSSAGMESTGGSKTDKLFPSESLWPDDDEELKFAMRQVMAAEIAVGLWPSQNLWPSESLYPSHANIATNPTLQMTGATIVIEKDPQGPFSAVLPDEFSYIYRWQSNPASTGTIINRARTLRYGREFDVVAVLEAEAGLDVNPQGMTETQRALYLQQRFLGRNIPWSSELILQLTELIQTEDPSFTSNQVQIYQNAPERSFSISIAYDPNGVLYTRIMRLIADTAPVHLNFTGLVTGGFRADIGRADEDDV